MQHTLDRSGIADRLAMCEADSSTATAPATTKPTIFKLVLSIAVGAAPMILVQMVSQIVLILTVQRLGRESAEWLAGASLGGLVYNVFGQMLMTAPTLAMDSVAPQAFGAGRLPEVGLAAQRSVATALLFLLPVPFVWAYAEPLLFWLGEPDESARLATTFVQALAAALPLASVYEANRRFLYAQDVTRPPLYAALLALALHPLWQELLVRRVGFAGGPLALLVTQATMTFGLLGFCAVRRPHAPGTWPGLRPLQLLRDTRAARRFVGLALAALLVLSEWLFWEFVCFRVGRFGEVPLAVHGVAYSLLPLLFMVPLGLSIGLSNGVGQKLGAGLVDECKRLAATTLAMGFGTIALTALVVYAARRAIFALYTSDARVLEGADAIWPWLCLDLLVDNTFAMLQVIVHPDSTLHVLHALPLPHASRVPRPPPRAFTPAHVSPRG